VLIEEIMHVLISALFLLSQGFDKKKVEWKIKEREEKIAKEKQVKKH
jgi:hypothetical protein